VYGRVRLGKGADLAAALDPVAEAPSAHDDEHPQLADASDRLIAAKCEALLHWVGRLLLSLPSPSVFDSLLSLLAPLPSCRTRVSTFCLQLASSVHVYPPRHCAWAAAHARAFGAETTENVIQTLSPLHTHAEQLERILSSVCDGVLSPVSAAALLTPTRPGKQSSENMTTNSPSLSPPLCWSVCPAMWTLPHMQLCFQLFAEESSAVRWLLKTLIAQQSAPSLLVTHHVSSPLLRRLTFDLLPEALVAAAQDIIEGYDVDASCVCRALDAEAVMESDAATALADPLELCETSAGVADSRAVGEAPMEQEWVSHPATRDTQHHSATLQKSLCSVIRASPTPACASLRRCLDVVGELARIALQHELVWTLSACPTRYVPRVCAALATVLCLGLSSDSLSPQERRASECMLARVRDTSSSAMIADATRRAAACDITAFVLSSAAV
jgi:hypothetical protein